MVLNFFQQINPFLRPRWADILWVGLMLAFMANMTYLLWPTPPSTIWVRPMPELANKILPNLASASDEELLEGLETARITTLPRHPSQTRSNSKVLKKVNLNTASYADLQHLPNVGPAMARKIMVFRQQHGHFTALEQLLEVPGIGPKKLAKMKAYCLL